jgi:haloacetate dehalogenase
VLLGEFARRRVRVGEVTLSVAVGGQGPPVVLLHGYPQTHVCWHKVAPRLAARFTVVCPDLRGYGDSDKPEGDPAHERYAKRAMADRWFALGGWHLLLLALPPDFPERLIGADAELWLDHLLDMFCGTPGAVTAEARDAYRRSFLDPATIHATCEDYRAGASVDLANDTADRERGRRIPAPVLALWQQPAGMQLPFDPLAVWRRWADEVDGHGLACGHLLAEERPDEVVEALRPFLGA